MTLNKLNCQYPVANVLLLTAGSTETDVLGWPGSVLLVLAANFTCDILISSTMQMRSLLMTVWSVLAKTKKCRHRSNIKWLAKVAHMTSLFDLRLFFHVATGCEERGNASVT